PGQKKSAVRWLTMATPARSPGSKLRPRSNGTPTVLKYSGETWFASVRPENGPELRSTRIGGVHVPAIGIRSAMATPDTCGRRDGRSKSCPCSRTADAASSGRPYSTANNRDVSYPVSARRATSNPRSSRPVGSSSTMDTATWQPTSRLLNNDRTAPAPAGEPSSFNVAFTSTEETRNAGESPKAKPAASETAKVYANTRRSGDSATNRPPPPCRNNCTVSVTCSQSIRAPHIDNNNPPKPPASASSRLSVSS